LFRGSSEGLDGRDKHGHDDGWCFLTVLGAMTGTATALGNPSQLLWRNWRVAISGAAPQPKSAASARRVSSDRTVRWV
jgi:hypothetical protein